MASMTRGSTTWIYTYDANGMRTKRTNGTTTYTYVYNGSQLTQMTVGSNTLDFIYDASGVPVVVIWDDTPYYYVTTLQGDIQLIMDLDGEIVVSYDYDAWGNIVSIGGTMASTLGVLNPLTYRGYVYDHETGLYYLQSRYYNPEWGRFLNADALVSTGQGILGNNMFAYCLNNPTNHTDSQGYYTDGQIHDFVIEEIVQEAEKEGRILKYERWDTMIIYDHAWRSKWFGFCDLYDPITGEIWEVKKVSTSYTCTTRYALGQLGNYVNNGYLVRDPELKRTFPTSSLGTGIFSKTDTLGNTYYIHYYDEGNGIIRYTYTVQHSQTQALLLTAAVAGATLLTIDRMLSKYFSYQC